MNKIIDLKHDWPIVGILISMLLLVTMSYWLIPLTNALEPVLEYFYAK